MKINTILTQIFHLSTAYAVSIAQNTVHPGTEKAKERIILQVPAKSSLRVNRCAVPTTRIASIERIELHNVLGMSQASLEAQNFR
ncbi:MAG: hypothetical protein ACYC59_09890 [Anaerolineaceae bacterium]